VRRITRGPFLGEGLSDHVLVEVGDHGLGGGTETSQASLGAFEVQGRFDPLPTV
jgi:hypothetical protein